MTGKRFEVFKTDTVIGINDNGKSIGNVYAVCDLLNEQHETIEQLRTTLKELKEIGDYQADRIQELSDENRQLEQQMQIILELTKKIEDCTHDMKLIGDVE